MSFDVGNYSKRTKRTNPPPCSLVILEFFHDFVFSEFNDSLYSTIETSILNAIEFQAIKNGRIVND